MGCTGAGDDRLAALLAKPEGDAHELLKLQPGTSVTKIAEKGAFMLIGKGGKRLGYIAKTGSFGRNKPRS